jgi:aminoglycoside 6'-N-acetyltransferase
MIGRGHAAAYLNLLAQRLCAEGAPLVAVDPHRDNLRAQRAYGKAGFRLSGSVGTETGIAVRMVYEPERSR